MTDGDKAVFKKMYDDLDWRIDVMGLTGTVPDRLRALLTRNTQPRRIDDGC